MDASEHFRGKKITVMGLGLLGRGVGDTEFLASCGAELIVTDLKSEEKLAESLKRLSTFPHIHYVLGEHRLQDFENRDLILKAAGVPLDSPFVAHTKEQGIPVRMSADLFAEISGIPLVGVTGTRGKSTTAHMLEAIYKAARKKVLLGGNVRGISTLALLPEATADHTAILELDSWQLQGFGEASISPHIAVFSTFFPDHLNYYKDDLDVYLADKAHIFLHQKQGDTLVLGEQAEQVVMGKYKDRINSTIIVAGSRTLPSDWVLALPGEHNRYDAGLALASARAAGIADAVSRVALESFTGVPGRLEFIKEVGGVKIYNDTTATTPEAAIAALKALDPEGKKNIVLITGGADKGLDMSALITEIPQRAKRVIMLAGTGTSRILGELPDASVFDTLKGAFEEAMHTAKEGDSVLLSPAFASFGMFKNEYDRGDQFTALVQAYE